MAPRDWSRLASPGRRAAPFLAAEFFPADWGPAEPTDLLSYRLLTAAPVPPEPPLPV